MHYLLDSDVLIEILRGNLEISDEISRLQTKGHTLAYTPVSKAEVYAGIRREEEAKTRHFFRGLYSLPIDDAIGEKAGEYLKKYAKSHGINIADAFLAASAFYYRCELITLNLKHYPMKDIKIFYI